jgi:uncharacterized membrane protein HdeD (DUF308 family)
LHPKLILFKHFWEARVKNYTEYWAATMIRGLLAIVASLAVLVIPEMASTILLRPFAVVMSICVLAAYATMDSAVVLISSFMIPKHMPGTVALRLQGICGAVIGALLFSLIYKSVDLHWFLYLAAIQAAGLAVTEFVVARGTSAQHGAMWCYAAAAIAAVSAVALVCGAHLPPRRLAWLIYCYLAVFGFNLFALSARMLFAERRAVRELEA